uniref:ATP-dependent RNA helicase n=1 Tax=Plectus sambesii TaxID=2011161 RepID=A0A914XP07_9BILA
MSAVRKILPLCRMCQKRLVASSSSSSGVFQNNDLPKPGLQVITQPMKWVQQEERRNKQIEKAYQDYEKKYGVDRRKSRLIISSPRKEFNHYDGMRYPRGEMPLICQYWQKNKYKDEWFTIHASGKKPAFNDLLPKQFSHFADSLHPKVLENIERLKYKRPTVVQARAIPAFSHQQHMFIAAETGSGKTLAVAAPILSDLIEQKTLGRTDYKAIFLSPGKELRNQTAAMISNLAKDTGLSVKLIDSLEEEEVLADVLVGTPGLVAEMMKSGAFDAAAAIRYLVIDEADMLLDDSFVPVLTDLFESITIGFVSLAGSRVEGTRLIFSSATLPDGLQTLVEGVVDTKNLLYVTSDHLHQVLPHVKQTFIRVREMDKLDKLVAIYNTKSADGQLLVFCKVRFLL